MEGRTERIKKVIRYLIGKGVASNQLDLGNKLGFNNKSYFSQLVNCRVNILTTCAKISPGDGKLRGILKTLDNGSNVP